MSCRCTLVEIRGRAKSELTRWLIRNVPSRPRPELPVKP